MLRTCDGRSSHTLTTIRWLSRRIVGWFRQVLFRVIEGLDGFGRTVFDSPRLLRSMTLTVAAAAIAASGAAIVPLAIGRIRPDEPKQPQTLEERITDLSAQLGDSARSISAIEAEIEARRQLVNDLRKQQQQYESLDDLRPEQVEAVAQSLREQIDESRSFWDTPLGIFLPNFITGLFFFTLGTFLVGPWLQRYRRRP